MTHGAEQIRILVVFHLISFLSINWEVELGVTVAIMIVPVRDSIQKWSLLLHQLLMGKNRIRPES